MTRNSVETVDRQDQYWLAASFSPAINQVRWIPKIAPVLVGGILISSALLKGYRLWVQPEFPPGLLNSAIIQLTLIEAEFGLGFAFLLTLWPRVVRVAGLTLFSVFFTVNLIGVLEGAHTCACFGIEVRPWATMSLDVGILCVLWLWRPIEDGTFRLLGLSVIGVISALLIFPMALGWSLGSRSPTVLSPTNLEAGSMRQGERRQLVVHLRNTLNKDLTITQANASCPCLEARGLPWRFVAGEDKGVPILLDLANEPEFLGDLTITLSGGTEMEPRMFHTEVRATVVSR